MCFIVVIFFKLFLYPHIVPIVVITYFPISDRAFAGKTKMLYLCTFISKWDVEPIQKERKRK